VVMGVGGLDRRLADVDAGGGRIGALLLPEALAFWPPPASTVKGPFLAPPKVFRSSIVPGTLGVATGLAESRGTGLGRSGRSLLGLLEDVVEEGEDLDDVFERGEGPLRVGDGAVEDMVSDFSGAMGLEVRG